MQPRPEGSPGETVGGRGEASSNDSASDISEVLVNSPAEPSWMTAMSAAATTPTIVMAIMPVLPVSFNILVTSIRTKWKKKTKVFPLLTRDRFIISRTL